MIYRVYYFIYKATWVPASAIIEHKETSDPTNNNQPTPPGGPTGPTAETTIENPTSKLADNSPKKAQKINQPRDKKTAANLDKKKQESERLSKWCYRLVQDPLPH